MAVRVENPRVILLELAAQGLRGALPASGRAAFRPGYVALRCDADALHTLLRALLWCDAEDGAALRTAAGHPVRAGCTFSAIDRAVYRLVSDLGDDFQLQRYDGASRTFSAVAADRASVSVFLADRGELRPLRRFEAMLCLRAADLPSRTLRGRVAALPARPPAADPEMIRARLAELRADLERSRSVDALQRQVDELQARLSELDEVLREGGRHRDAVAAAEARMRAHEALASAAEELGDVETRLSAHDRAAARREEAAARISGERAAIAATSAASPPLWKVPQLWAGVALGVVALGVGLSATGGARYVALLDVPAFGWAAWTALRWVGRVEAAERAEKRARVVDERERKVHDQFEAEAGAVRRAMEAAGVATVEDLRAALSALADARAAHRAALEAEEEWLAHAGAADVEREHAAIDARLRDAGSALGALTADFVRDVGTLEAEISRLEGELATATRQWGGPAAPAAGGDPILELAHAAARELGEDGAALQRLQQRTGEILASVSGHRVEGLWDSVDARAVMPSGKTLPLVDLPVEARDLCWVALKLALIEQELESHGGFAFVDSAADALPLSARRVAAHVLKKASRAGQVLHVTDEAIFREAADSAA